jgi:hypothetical protein
MFGPRLGTALTLHFCVQSEPNRHDCVTASLDYTYDPLYRLMSESGRDNLGQAEGEEDVVPQIFQEIVWLPISSRIRDAVGNLLVL